MINIVEFSITSSQILWFLGFIASAWTAWKIVKEIKKPGDDLRSDVDRHEELLRRDNERMQEVEKSNKMILQCLLVIINHDITGNGIDKMKAARDELQEYLINR